MLRSPFGLVLIATIVVAALIFALSQIDASKSPQRVEKVVPENALGK